MSDESRDRELERMAGFGLSSRNYDALLHMKSSEQTQAEWNAIETRKLHREQGQNLVEVIIARVQTLEAKLQADDELIVYCDAGSERIRVSEFEFPTWNLAIMIGIDDNGNEMHRIENVQDVKLTCKVLKAVSQGHHPIGFILPAEK